MLLREDVGGCPICGAAHTTCTASTGPITVVMTPARDGAANPVESVIAPAPVPLQAERVQETLPAGQVTTGTYRGIKAKR